ncbi:MAG: PD40 domain-containing protein [Myxococcaceae bacterium]|nr:PD40 domain-containing protein [Myxococcaceae bacterium]
MTRPGLVVVLVALAGLGCGKKKSAAGAVGGVGVLVAGGLATDLRISPDAKTAAYLKEAQKPRLEGVPSTMRVGELWVVPTAGGSPKKLGNGVSNFPGGYLFTADSKWVLELVGYNASAQAGELDIAPVDGSSDVQKLGSRVTYMVGSPDSKWVAFVDEGILKLGPLPAGPFRDVNGEVANAEFSPDSTLLFFKRKQSAGGGLLAVKVADAKEPPKKLADLVGDYRVSDDGKRIAFASKSSPSERGFRLYLGDTATLKDKKVGENVFAFKFSADSKWLARLEGSSPEAGGDFFVTPSDGSSAGKNFGANVRDFAFSPDQKLIAWRQNYVPEHAEGYGDVLMAELPEGAPRMVGRRARSFEWSPDSKAIAFAFDVVKPIRSVNLYLWRVDGTEAIHVKDWVYDYDFTPQSDRLIFRAECVREGRACNLLSVSAANPKEAPKKLIEGVFGFKLSNDGARVLFTYARMQGDLYDTGVLNLKSGEFKTLDQQIRMPPYLLDDSGTKVAYLIAERQREGLYVADKVP